MADPTTTLDERFSAPGAAAVPWARTRDTLAAAQLFALTTVRADGRPHQSPLVAVWLDDAIFFATGPTEQKYRNLEVNPNVLLTTGPNDWQHGLEIVVEGVAERVTDRDLLERLVSAWATKWDGQWKYTAGDQGFRHMRDPEGDFDVHVFRVAPTKILAFGKAPFSHTRYRL
jgi:general stress protein 26